jgi:hypothetical protein
LSSLKLLTQRLSSKIGPFDAILLVARVSCRTDDVTVCTRKENEVSPTSLDAPKMREKTTFFTKNLKMREKTHYFPKKTKLHVRGEDWTMVEQTLVERTLIERTLVEHGVNWTVK